MTSSNLTAIGRNKFNTLIQRKSWKSPERKFTPNRLTYLNQVFNELGSNKIPFSYFAEKRNENEEFYPICLAYRKGLLKIEGDCLVKTLLYSELSHEAEDEYPFESYSWEVLSESVAVKHMDKSSLIHHGTGIPNEIRHFFNIENLHAGGHKDIHIYFNSKRYEAYFSVTKLDRTRLFWKTDFEKVLQNTLPDWYAAFSKDIDVTDEPPVMRFKQLNEKYSEYEVEIIFTKAIKSDIEAESSEEPGPTRAEGGAKYYYGKRYERNPELRSRAIEIHGLSCIICGFNFEREYGNRGQGFIEVHHTKPLSIFKEEQIVNPKTDLVPVCANCHRMIHRRRDDVLSMKDLVNIFTKAKKANG